MIPSRNVWHPLGRPPTPPPEPLDQDEPPLDADAIPELAIADEESEPDAWDELAAMDDADFYRQLRVDVDAVAAGELPGFHEKPKLQNRPWSKRHKIRDRRGAAY